jgi:hypothetical protein
MTKEILPRKKIDALIGMVKKFEHYHVKDLIKFLK